MPRYMGICNLEAAQGYPSFEFDKAEESSDEEVS
jgi:hypothetical protein